jgi:uncharacterized protein (DUF58 family)
VPGPTGPPAGGPTSDQTPGQAAPGQTAGRKGRKTRQAKSASDKAADRAPSALRWRLQALTAPVRARWATLTKALAPVWAAIRPVLAIVRPAGWATLGLAVGTFVIGRRLGWQEFLVVALLAAALLLGAIGFVVGRSTYAVTLDLTRLRVRVGADAYGGLTVVNTSSRALLPSVFILPVGRATSAFHVPRLGGHETYEESFQLDTSKRAVVPLGPVRSARGDGLGLLRREAKWTDVEEVFIHPRTISLQGSSAGFLKDLEGRPTDTLSSSDIAFHALRDYVVGDDLRHVHWKSSARTGKLLVRQFEETRRSHLVLCLSMTPEDYGSEADFELAVAVAASLGEQAIRDEKDLTIQVPGRRLRVQTATRMLDDFSRLEFGGAVVPLETAALAAAQAAPDASVVMVLAGTPVTPARLHAVTARFGVDALTVVLRCETGAGLARSAIGPARVLTLGDLDDLPRAVRSLEV